MELVIYIICAYQSSITTTIENEFIVLRLSGVFDFVKGKQSFRKNGSVYLKVKACHKRVSINILIICKSSLRSRASLVIFIHLLDLKV